MKPIIAATDFSSISRNAVNYAAELANGINAPLVLFHVVQMPLSIAETPLAAMNLDEFVHDAENEFAGIKQHLLLNIGSSLQIEISVVIGSVEHELENICKVKKPFAVVMGTEDSSDTSRFFIGRNTYNALINLNETLFIIPPDARFKQIKRIAFAADLKDVYDVPVDELSTLMKLFNATLDIVHVSANGEQTLKNAIPSAILQNRLKALHPHFEFVINENINDGIEQFAKTYADDMILALPKKHSIFSFHKSETKKLILHPALPLLTLPARIE